MQPPNRDHVTMQTRHSSWNRTAGSAPSSQRHTRPGAVTSSSSEGARQSSTGRRRRRQPYMASRRTPSAADLSKTENVQRVYDTTPAGRGTGRPTSSSTTPTSAARAETNAVTLSDADLAPPFVSHDDAMWPYFEPELARRLEELDVDDSASARACGAPADPAVDGWLQGRRRGGAAWRVFPHPAARDRRRGHHVSEADGPRP